MRRGSDKGESGILAGLRESGVFAQESVTGMDRFRAMAARGIENAVDIQIAFGRWRGTDVRGFVGFPDVQRGAIDIGINCHRTNAHLAESANDSQGDLAAVGNQNFREHCGRL